MGLGIRVKGFQEIVQHFTYPKSWRMADDPTVMHPLPPKVQTVRRRNHDAFLGMVT